MSPLSYFDDDELYNQGEVALIKEIILFRKALKYCLNQQGDDNCWMDYRHLLMRFLPADADWQCLGGDKGKTIKAKITGTLDCL